MRSKISDYVIISVPDRIELVCPYCTNKIALKFKKMYWDHSIVDCPECGRDIELGEWEYD